MHRQDNTIVRLTPAQSDLVREWQNKKNNDDFSFTIPVRGLSRCMWCDAMVAKVALTDGDEVDVEAIADSGSWRADLVREHRCDALKRWEAFRNAPTEDRE